MSVQIRHEINPDIIWSNESKGRILIIDLLKKKEIWLTRSEAIMSRSIWQGISPLIWTPQLEEQGADPMEILNTWINSGLICEVQS